ncbi:MAG: 4-hydroxyphenylpyruvate dioxygenase [Gammaproteobacteria bacterium]|nr:4-hydroxyphenylpyruvate dioxygenase [Gammaproteobacteria bacterium]
MEKHDNPCGLNGFAFVEFSAPDATVLHQQFKSMGFALRATHKNAPITHYQQGDIHFIVNATTDSQAAEHAKLHGAGACAMGFRVQDAKAAFQYALQQGAKPFVDEAEASHELLAIEGIGQSVIYFIEENHLPFENEWVAEQHPAPVDIKLTFIDHLTHNVYRGNMDKWAEFYFKIFNFREIRYFDIQGKLTGLVSRALSSPCDLIKIPLNESKDDISQIEEFLQDYHGEGIQHIALASDDIYHSIDELRQLGVQFLTVPDTYYEMIHDRVPWHQEPLEKLQKAGILVDGELDPQHGLLLQLFTENVFGPVFFEIIQRKGNEGFGEGNFKALFEAIERDQIRRGTLTEAQS